MPGFFCLGILKRIADLASRRGNETIRFHPEYREPIVAGIEIERCEKTRGVP